MLVLLNINTASKLYNATQTTKQQLRLDSASPSSESLAVGAEVLASLILSRMAAALVTSSFASPKSCRGLLSLKAAGRDSSQDFWASKQGVSPQQQSHVQAGTRSLT